MKFTSGTCYIAAIGLTIRSFVTDANSTAGAIICVATLAFIVLATYFGERK